MIYAGIALLTVLVALVGYFIGRYMFVESLRGQIEHVIGQVTACLAAAEHAVDVCKQYENQASCNNDRVYKQYEELRHSIVSYTTLFDKLKSLVETYSKDDPKMKELLQAMPWGYSTCLIQQPFITIPGKEYLK